MAWSCPAIPGRAVGSDMGILMFSTFPRFEGGGLEIQGRRGDVSYTIHNGPVGSDVPGEKYVP